MKEIWGRWKSREGKKTKRGATGVTKQSLRPDLDVKETAHWGKPLGKEKE